MKARDSQTSYKIPQKLLRVVVTHRKESLYVDCMVKCRLGTVKLKTAACGHHLQEIIFLCILNGQMQARNRQISDRIPLTLLGVIVT